MQNDEQDSRLYFVPHGRMSCLPVSDSSFDVAAAAILQFCCMTLKLELEALSNESRQTKRDDAFF